MARVRTDIAHPCRRCDPQGSLTVELIIEAEEGETPLQHTTHQALSHTFFNAGNFKTKFFNQKLVMAML